MRYGRGRGRGRGDGVFDRRQSRGLLVITRKGGGAGTAIVEALRCGRYAIGLTGQRRWWRLARTNVSATKARGVYVDGMVLVLDRRPGTAGAAATAGLTGRVDLLLTTLRPAGPDGDITGALDRLHSLLSQYRPLVRPGGHVVITCAPQRHPTRHDLLDVASQIAATGTAAGEVRTASARNANRRELRLSATVKIDRPRRRPSDGAS